MARTTYTEISHRLVDVSAQPDAEYSGNDILEYSSFGDIKTEDFIADNIFSDERNYNILDGSLQLIPDNPTDLNWGFWTESKTDENGDFATNPILNATFGSVHTSSGVTFIFSGDSYPQQINIIWYNGTMILADQTFEVDSMKYFADLTVENYNKIVMTFIGMDIPRRHLKISEIAFGQIRVWGQGDILKSNVLEEVDLTSNEITINTLEFSVNDESQDFNMLNPDGVYSALQQKQKLIIKQFLNGIPRDMGRFYLDTWENTSATVAEFTAYDAIGLFDSIDYITSPMWNDEPAGNVFVHIFNVAGWTNFTIEPSVASETVRGYVPACTVRQALQHLCFSLRCSCIVSREGIVKIMRLPSSTAPYIIEKSQKFGKPTIKQNSLVNSVAVTGYEFSLSSEASQLYGAELAAGTYQIAFSTPVANLSITGGAITESGINYACINITTAGAVAIIGNQYEAHASVYTHEKSGITSATRSQKSISDIYLINTSNMADVAEFIYNDYQRRIVQNFRMAIEDEKAGDNVDVDTMMGVRKSGVITSLDIDLTSGFVAKAEVRG